MPSFVFIILRLLVIFAIGLVTYMVLTKLITWPQRSKAKRTGQIVEDQTDDKSKIIKLYLFIWIIMVVAGYLTIRYLL
ncbi:MAG TPA: hypothetical protein GXZ21_07975 [Clostridiales bacterium]|nr:hypothetical protein [Clostridiales bacterium]